ncbi:uncharacterized protein LOC117328907 [Pecten maximus]|uniref:uncharacterized protein LOC117328907 n=1 Tax=Pecten maximus TaxID=6579 RepID=UPI001458F833|nr:uncharacterized protein LOC117328907 [Pecten maximus]
MKRAMKILLGLPILYLISCYVCVNAVYLDEPDCGVIYGDTTEVKKMDYIYEPLRTIYYQSLWNRMTESLYNHSRALGYIDRLSNVVKEVPHLSLGRPVCQPETKTIYGYFKLGGKVLCLIVEPNLQQVEHISCSEKTCCNNVSRCFESGIFTQRILVYCDYFFPELPSSIDIIEDDPALLDTEALLEDHDDGNRRKRSIASDTGYFAFRFLERPSTCSCGLCYEI